MILKPNKTLQIFQKKNHLGEGVYFLVQQDLEYYCYTWIFGYWDRERSIQIVAKGYWEFSPSTTERVENLLIPLKELLNHQQSKEIKILNHCSASEFQGGSHICFHTDLCGIFYFDLYSIDLMDTNLQPFLHNKGRASAFVLKNIVIKSDVIKKIVDEIESKVIHNQDRDLWIQDLIDQFIQENFSCPILALYEKIIQQVQDYSSHQIPIQYFEDFLQEMFIEGFEIKRFSQTLPNNLLYNNVSIDYRYSPKLKSKIIVKNIQNFIKSKSHEEENLADEIKLVHPKYQDKIINHPNNLGRPKEIPYGLKEEV